MGNSITESVPFPFYYLLVLRLAYRTWLGNSILPVFPVAFAWPLHPHSHPHFMPILHRWSSYTVMSLVFKQHLGNGGKKRVYKNGTLK